MARTIAMMQPYLFPYLGYFQLIAAADVFVLGDDLQYIRSGWVNRNRILQNGEAKLITFPLKRDHFDLPINQRQLSDTFEEEADRLINLICQSYRKAPYFAQVMPLLERLIRFPQQNLAMYTKHGYQHEYDEAAGALTYAYLRKILGDELEVEVADEADEVAAPQA